MLAQSLKMPSNQGRRRGHVSSCIGYHEKQFGAHRLHSARKGDAWDWPLVQAQSTPHAFVWSTTVLHSGPHQSPGYFD